MLINILNYVYDVANIEGGKCNYQTTSPTDDTCGFHIPVFIICFL